MTKYAKRIPITDSVKAAITRINAGNSIDFDAIAVYETKTLNTKPLRKRGGLYKNAKTDESVLDGMVDSLNNSTEGVPMHLMHNTSMLNVGKAFRATKVKRDDGHSEVVTQFYIPLVEESLVARLDTGAVDQVSVGLIANKIKCSHCDFDWKQAGFMELMDLTCSEGHTVGEDGVHVVSTDGLDSWFELSLVDSGASTDARITDASRSKFVESAQFYQLAASNQNELKTSLILIANVDESFSEELPPMDENKVNELIKAALAAKDDDTQSKIDAAVTAAVAPKDAKIAELEAKVAELTAAQPTEDQAAVAAKLTAAEATVAKATEFINDQALKAQIAAGVATPATPADLDAAITQIKDSGVMIAKLFAKDAAALELKAAKANETVVSPSFRRSAN